jgi:hypothetical protein
LLKVGICVNAEALKRTPTTATAPLRRECVRGGKAESGTRRRNESFILHLIRCEDVQLKAV